jgi:hypothetical protein
LEASSFFRFFSGAMGAEFLRLLEEPLNYEAKASLSLVGLFPGGRESIWSGGTGRWSAQLRDVNLETALAGVVDDLLQLAGSGIVNPFLPTLRTNGCSHLANNHNSAADIGGKRKPGSDGAGRLTPPAMASGFFC